MTISNQIALAAIFILWISFCFPHINEQKFVGMVCTNNVERTYSEKPSRIIFWIKKRRSVDAVITNSIEAAGCKCSSK